MLIKLFIIFELGVLVGVGIMCFFQAGKEGKRRKAMSKRKDRSYTDYRCCPICQSKCISVEIEKKFWKEKYYIYCYKCEKKIKVGVCDAKQRRNRKI